MKQIHVYLPAMMLVFTLSADEPRFIGSWKCAGMCHNSDKGGDQFKQWQNSIHAKAYKTLATAESRMVAKKAGVSGNPQKAPECLRCHVTGYGVRKNLIDSTCNLEEGVGCEACHGPGSKYRKLSIMKNHQKALAAGMIEQNSVSCTRCHNEESPNYKLFKFEEEVKKVLHPIPNRGAKK